MFEEGNRFLVVAAHPDDEVLAIGGILARAKSSGVEVAVQFLGEGVSARYELDDLNSKSFRDATSKRMEGASSALKMLGIKRFSFENNLCCRFDSIDSLDLVKLVEREIAEFNPTHIFTHSPVEVNIDHRITHRVVETAVRPKPGLALKNIYAFEVPCSGNWTFAESFKPNLYVDVRDVWEQKIAAWNFYVGEERDFPFPRSAKGLETMAHYRGMQAGFEYAEGLQLLRGLIDA